MKKSISYILIVILLVVLVVMWIDKDSGHDQALYRLKKKHYYAMDSSAKVAEYWRLKALEYGNQYRREATRAMKSETNLIYALEENRILKRRVIHYSNNSLDSIFVARYGR